MSNRSLQRLGVVMIGLLAISAFLLTISRSEDVANPSAASFDPSGTHALLELIRKEGIPVEVTRDPTPRVNKYDTLLAVFQPGTTGLFEVGEAAPIETFIKGHVENGGSAIVTAVSNNFKEASRAALQAPVTIVSADGTQKRTASLSNAFSPIPASLQYDREYSEEMWQVLRGYQSFARIYGAGQGVQVILDDGIFLTNRFLDRQDNAAVAMDIIRRVVDERGKIVFLEAAHGDEAESGLLDNIGPWASAAWWQILLLFGVIIYTLGKRFGHAEEDRYVQTGQRELVDAVAMIYQRSRATHVALRSLPEYADRQLRRVLKLPMDAPRSARDERLPEKLAALLRQAEIASEQRVHGSVAIDLAAKLDRELQIFLGDRHVRVKRRSKH